MNDRCQECGSWLVECGSDGPIYDCGCARCANARVESVETELVAFKAFTDKIKRKLSDSIAERMRLGARLAGVKPIVDAAEVLIDHVARSVADGIDADCEPLVARLGAAVRATRAELEKLMEESRA